MIGPEALFPKLKPGPGLPAEVVLADQRRRLQGAIISLVLDGGWRQVKVREVVRTAGVSSSSFYKHFANTDECFASALDVAVDDLLGGLEPNGGQGGDWRDLLRVTVAKIMSRFASHPAAARVALIDSFAAGPSARKRVGVTVTRLEEILGACLSGSLEQGSPPRHLIAGMTGGLLRVLRTTVAAGRAGELPRLTPVLVDWLSILPSPEILSLPTVDESQLPQTSPLSPLMLLDGRPADNRRRLLQTAMRLATDDGFSKLTAPRVRRDAGVPRRAFERLFVGVDECFLEGIDALTESVATEANRSGGENWTKRSHRTISSLCSTAAENRRLARVTFLEIFAAGRDGLLRREQIIGRAAGALRRTIPAEERPSLLVAEASVAAAWHVAQADVSAGRSRSLPSVAPLLSYLVLAPVVGAKPALAAICTEDHDSGLVNA